VRENWPNPETWLITQTCLIPDRALSGRHPVNEGIQALMADTKSRPLSPHLTIWRWGPNMAVSILHRATGVALSFAGLALLTKAATHPIGLVVLVGLTWSFFQHLLSGIRHLVMDTGAGLELGINKTFAVVTVVGSLLLTVVLWVYLLGVAK
jgi:succinate dehydrogenase / fumarate reductase cytochrome b subunit